MNNVVEADQAGTHADHVDTHEVEHATAPKSVQHEVESATAQEITRAEVGSTNMNTTAHID